MKLEIRVFDNVKDLLIVSEPAKEDEPVVPVEITRPDVTTLPVAWTPLEISRPPAKELEPVKLEFKVFDNSSDREIPNDPAKVLDAVAPFWMYLPEVLA